MASLRTQNALLFVIALCLVLLVVHVYSDVDLVSKAYADQPASSDVRLWGKSQVEGVVRWQPVQVDGSGRLMIAK